MRYNKFKKELKNEYNDFFKDDSLPELAYRPKRNYLAYLPFAVATMFLFIIALQIAIYNTGRSIHNNNLNNQNKVDYEYISNHDYFNLDKLDNTDDLKTGEYERLFYIEDLYTSRVVQTVKAIDVTAALVDKNGTPTSAQTPATSTETNNQKEGVSESDVAKFDGEYFYYIAGTNSDNKLIIYDLSGNKLVDKFISEIYQFTPTITYRTYRLSYNILYKYYNFDIDIYDNKIILTNSYLLLILEFDGTNLTKLYSNEFASLDTTRLIDNMLYVVGSYSPRFNQIDEYLSDNAYYLACSRYIYPSIYKIMRINLDNLEIKEIDNVVDGYDVVVYMDKNYLAIYNEALFEFYDEGNDQHYYKDVNLISLFDLNLEVLGSYKLQGSVLNQYSIDIKDNYLRVVSTNNSRINNKINALTIFDLNKKIKVGEINENLGIDLEIVKSVSFNDDLCYVVTYRNTDPLYEIDLSNPYEPKIISILKMPGYSSYMYNFSLNGKDYILGVGRGDSTDIKKISLFEVNNGENLVLDDYLISYNNYPVESIVKIDLNVAYLYNCFSEGKRLFFYNDGTTLYFGVQLTRSVYYLFNINPESDNIIDVYKTYETNGVTRLFLYNGIIYIPTIEKLIIEEWS